MARKKSRPNTDAVMTTKNKKSPGLPLDSQRSTWFVVLFSILPFIFSRNTMDPVIVPRYMFLTIFMMAYTLLFYFIRRNISSPAANRRIYFVFLAGILFCLWSVITSVLSINPADGIFELVRQWVNLAYLFLVFHLIATSADDALMRISKVFLFIAGIHALVGMLQYAGIAFESLPGSNALPYGLMANRNLYGSAMVFTLPFIALTWWRATPGWKTASVIVSGLLAISIILSQTRSAWLATLVFFICSGLLFFIFIKNLGKKWMLATGAFMGLGLLVAVIFIVADDQGALSMEIKTRSGMNVAGADTSSAITSINDRYTIWQKTRDVIKKHPVTGVGMSNWKIRVAEDGSQGTSWAGGNYVPDRVHNVYLQVTAETGVIGLILFLVFWISVGLAGLALLSKSKNENAKLIVVLMFSGLASFATDAFFSFPLERIEHSAYIYLMAGAILGCYASYLNDNNGQTGKPVSFFLKVVILVVSIAGLTMALTRKKFENAMYSVKAAEQQGMNMDVVAIAEEGKTSWIPLDQEGLSLEAKQAVAYRNLKKYREAIEVMKKAMVYNPNSPMVYNNLGTIYSEMGEFKTAIPYFEKALKLAPDFDIVKKNLVVNYFNVGEYRKSVQMMNSFNYKQETYFIDLMKEAEQKLADSTASPATPVK